MKSESSLLDLTRNGYRTALTAESDAGYFASVTHFRVASNSVKTSEELLWGTEVFYGPISDYEYVGNTILFTLVVPAYVEQTEIDSVALFSDGVIFAQGFLRKTRTKTKDAALYVYAYINAPEPDDLVEVFLRRNSTFPQVADFADLPSPATAFRSEAVVTNGHCGHRQNLPEYTPVAVTATAQVPRTRLVSPDEPFTDTAIGTLVAGTYEYEVTATNGVGETLPSPAHSIVLVQLTPPDDVLAEQAEGDLAAGTYEYTVTAVATGGGDSLPSAIASAVVTRMATPSAPSYVIDNGGLDAGTYFYRVAACNSYGTTVASAATTVVVPDDSGVALAWPPVAGATSYKVYVGATALTTYFVAEVDVASAQYFDWGADRDNTKLAPVSASDGGVKLTWTKVDNAVGYNIYGRSGTRGLLGFVEETSWSFNDYGTIAPTTAEPTTNTSATGVTVKWSAVEGATGYKVYGRSTSKGLLAATSALFWTDTGAITAGAAAPSTNTTDTFEWALVDGTLLYRGTPAAVTSTTFEIPFDATAKDLSMAYVSTGTGAGQARHIRYDEETETYLVIDKPFSPVPTTSSELVIWAGPGCCGGRPVQASQQELYPVPVTPTSAPPEWSWLGVHVCGLFLGQPIYQDRNQKNDAGFSWAARTNPNRISSATMEFLFCDENGKSQYELQLSSPLQTPHGNRLPLGAYASVAEAAVNAVRFTLDAIAVPPGVRLLIYSGPNFTGDVILDDIGPFYIANYVWRDDPRFGWALELSVWQGVASQIIPATRRYWSDEVESLTEFKDLRELKNCSFYIVKGW